MRTCVGCLKEDESAAMIRLVLGEDGGLGVDLSGRAFGRGAWVHPSVDCLERGTRGGLGQHPVIADNCNATGLRRFNAAFANSALKCLKGFQFCEEISAVLGFDEMDKGIVVEPQRQIAKEQR